MRGNRRINTTDANRREVTNRHPQTTNSKAMKIYKCPSCKHTFQEKECNTRPFAPLDCGVLATCPKCEEEFEATPLREVSSAWPKLNKQDCINSYVDQIKSGQFDLCKAIITDTVCLTSDEWDDFRKHLLTDRPWLEEKGGSFAYGVRAVVLVIRPGETKADSLALLVDPQGYAYARYVGFYHDMAQHKIGNVPDLPTLEEAMHTTICGVSMKDRILNAVTA